MPQSLEQGRPHPLWVLFVLLILTLLNGRAASAAGSGKQDPCSFLTITEVEAVMGPLAGPPFRTSGGVTPQPNGGTCRYEAPDRRAISLNVTWDGGKDLIAMMGAMQAMVEGAGLRQLKLLDGTTIAGHWDQAALNQCCEFNALRGDKLVTVDIAGSRATVGQAASLADAAIQRLDQPLAISGDPGMKPAQDRAAQRPKPRNVCDLVSRADAEAIAGVSLSELPKGSNKSCHYAWTIDGQGSTYELELMVTWQEGFSEIRTTGAAVGNASAMLGMAKLQGPVAASRNNGPWDEFSQSIIGVAAVKDDVMVSVEGGPIRQDLQRALVERAIANLRK